MSRRTSGKDYKVSPLSRSCQLDDFILASSHLDGILSRFEALAGPDRRSQRQHAPKWTSRITFYFRRLHRRRHPR